MATLTIKKSVLALGISMAFSSAVMANSAVLTQTGDDNVALLLQTGSGQSIAADQIGVENEMSLIQTGVGSSLIALQDGYQNNAETRQIGDGNSLDLTQLGVAGNHIDYYLMGNNSYGLLYQSGANLMTIDSYGDSNGLIADQFGEDNTLTLYVQGDGNDVGVFQSGNDNLSELDIQGADDGYIYSSQSGQSNLAYVDVYARNSNAISTNNQVAVIQDGDHNLTDIALRGDGNYVRSEQLGYDNTMTLTQPAHFGTNVESLQQGINNDLSVNIGGSDNGLNSHQWGDDNMADVNFTSRRNYGASEQHGQLNTLNLLVSNQYNSFDFGQYGDNNKISGLGGGAFEMGGDGGYASLMQTGTMNLIQASQMSDASNMSVVQNGSMNNAIIVQQ